MPNVFRDLYIVYKKAGTKVEGIRIIEQCPSWLTLLIILAGTIALFICSWKINCIATLNPIIDILGYSPKWAVFGMVVTHAFLAVALKFGLERLPHPPSQPWIYRLALYISFSAAAAMWIVLWISGARPSPTVLLAAACGAIAGAMLLSFLKQGLWENNYPPPDDITEKVYQIHLNIVGNPSSPTWDKRLFDIFLALIGLVITIPLWMLFSFLIWLEDPGPIFFVKNSVGRGGKNFHQFKFRTMVRDAENSTGPIMADQEDERVLSFGQFLRRTALDELPQLINVLIGEMSFVGPRPQRTVLVFRYLQIMPEYTERHRVAPGLAGLAQVAGDYYLTPRQKLRYDRIYIHHASLAFDIRLIVLAFMIVFWFRWRPSWNGRLPRKWLRIR